MTTCLRRILDLPRRAPVCPEGLADTLTELLKTPKGTMTLRPLQALALHDIGTCGGGFLPLDVGEGKTLTSLLAAYVLDAKRPLLLLPANLILKTARESKELAKHWRIPTNVRLMSYQMLGLVQSARDLEVYAPDLIIKDESQKVKNRDAAVTRRVERYLTEHPDTKVVTMTGTIMRKSIRDFAHILRWALKDKAPIPMRDSEVDEWAMALDESIDNEFKRIQPGALLMLADPAEIEELGEVVAARRGFRRRLRETPGVVASAEEGAEVSAGLAIAAIRYDVSKDIQAFYTTLREEKIAPTGEELWEAVDVWKHARELALGFCQRWDPPAPEDWKLARREWFQFVRGVMQRSRKWDSPDHVAHACDAGELPGGKLAAWRSIKDSFVPNPVPVWHDDTALQLCMDWMRNPGLVWTAHVPFAERLSKLSGNAYYGAEGLNAAGEFIDDAHPGRAVIVSVAANREGRNLQSKWSRNLITTMPEGWDFVHQLVGRTHRPGQKAEVVTVDILLGCSEHARAWIKACEGAKAARDTTGAMSKLLVAQSVKWPSSEAIASFRGSQWQ